MSEEFKPINSQEELESVLKDRLNRQNEKHSREMAELKAKYADFDQLKAQNEESNAKISSLNDELSQTKEKMAGLDTQIAERDAKIKAYELSATKARVASEFGLSLAATQFLQGTDEDALRQSAESLKNLVGATVRTPKISGEPAGTGETNRTESAMRQMVKSFNGGN